MCFDRVSTLVFATATGTTSQTTSPTTTTATTTETTTTATTTGTMTPNLLCLAYTECTEGQYEAMAPTEFLDRKCKDHTLCEYKELRISGTPLTTVVGEMVLVEATAVTDRACGELSVCSDAQWEVTAPTLAPSGYPDAAGQPLHAVGDRTCANVTVCDAGLEFETASPSRTSDRQCAPYSDPCVLGVTYESVRADATTDRVCSAVGRQCLPGEFMERDATLLADRVCTVCVRGTVDHDQDPATQCAFCPGGTYQEDAGQTKCRDSSRVWPIGPYEYVASNRTTAGVCAYCNGATEYQDEAGKAECKSVSDCEPGTYTAGWVRTSCYRL
jgi:hypothetical protein